MSDPPNYLNLAAFGAGFPEQYRQYVEHFLASQGANLQDQASASVYTLATAGQGLGPFPGGLQGVSNMQPVPSTLATMPYLNATAVEAQAHLVAPVQQEAGRHRRRAGTHNRKRQRRHGDSNRVADEADHEPPPVQHEAGDREDADPATSVPVSREAVALALLKQAGVQHERCGGKSGKGMTKNLAQNADQERSSYLCESSVIKQAEQDSGAACRALRALQETADQCAQADADGWADEAQVWLACNAEFEEERDKLAEAMQASLTEAEHRRAAEAPLEERSPEELAKVFGDSQLLRALGPLHGLPSLLHPPLKQQLLRYLQLEKRCKKWYLVSQHYFQQRAAECALQVAAASLQCQSEAEGEGTQATGGTQNAAAPGDAVPGKVAAAASGTQGRRQGSRRSSRHCSPALLDQEAAPRQDVKGKVAVRRGKRATKGQQAQQAQQQQEQQAAQLPGSEGEPAQQGLAGGEGDGGAASGGHAKADARQPSRATPPAAPGGLPPTVAAVIARFVDSCCTVVEGAVYAMPSEGAQTVPQLFTDAAVGVPPEENCVELLD